MSRRKVLLYLAGPYVRRAPRFENATTAGQQQVAAAIDGVFDRLPAPSTESLSEALAALGMPRDVVITYLSAQVGLRRFGDAWVRWGDSTADKAEAVLHVHGQPRTPEDIFDAIGPGYTSLRAVREALYEDHRFIRTSRQTLGLRGWGIDEYGGVFDEIGHRIDAAGGKIHIDALVADIGPSSQTSPRTPSESMPAPLPTSPRPAWSGAEPTPTNGRPSRL